MLSRKICQLYTALVLLGGPVLAQTSLTNTGVLYISGNSDVLYVSGDFSNGFTASLTNNGQLYLKQVITNNQAAMPAGTGKLYVNGTVPQVLDGTEPFRTFDLETGNATGFTLNNDLHVSGTHTFTNGLVHTSGTPNYLVYESGAAHSGSADSRHVTGWVRKNGSGDFTFPVGDNSYLRSIAVSALSAVSTFNCHYYTPTQNIYNLFSPIVKVKANEYWQLDQLSGGTAQVTLNWDNPRVAMDNEYLTDIRAGLYTGGYWTNAGGAAGGDVTTTGSITSGTLNSFGPFTLAYLSFPIPLKLVSFRGWRSGGVSYLHWISENEQDVSHFSVERSFDGTLFSAIGQQPARNSGIKELYHAEDMSAFTGTAYYRLKSVDNDGSYQYSKVISLTEGGSPGPAITVLNPVRNAITIFNRSAPAGLYDYRLCGASGQLVQQGFVQLTGNGAAVIRLPLQVAKGIYTLQLMKGEVRFSQQLLVEN